MFKTVALFLTLSLAAFGGTNKENAAAFNGLPDTLLTSIREKLVDALGEFRVNQKWNEIATRWDHTAMLSVVAKYVEAEKEKDPIKRLRAKELVKREDLAVEAEIWRWILGKNQEKPFIANEEQREAVVEALAGEDVLRALSVNYRANLAEEAAKLLAQQEADKRAQEARDAALEGERTTRRAQRQQDRATGLRNKIHSEFVDDLFAMNNVTDSGPIGTRAGLNNKILNSIPKSKRMDVDDTTPKRDAAPGDLPQRDEMRRLIKEMIKAQNAAKKPHADAQSTDGEEVHEKK